MTAWTFWGGLGLLVTVFVIVGGLMAAAKARHVRNSERIAELLARRPPVPTLPGEAKQVCLACGALSPLAHGGRCIRCLEDLA